MRLRDFSSGAAIRALGWLGAAYIRLAWATTRWRVEGLEHRQALIAAPGPLIGAFWHNRIVFSPMTRLPGRRAHAVISANRDGEFMAAVARSFGVALIRGSSADPRKPMKDKGGRAAYAASLRALRAGDTVVIAVDGPRGPRMRVQPGAAALALAASAPIAPVAFATRRGRYLDSWDRFLLPWPFDSGVMVYGAPLPPPARATPGAMEAHRQALEAALTEVSRRADILAGRAPIAAAPQA